MWLCTVVAWATHDSIGETWRQDAYVWQRTGVAEGGDVMKAIEASRDYVSSFCVLAAEISWNDGQASVVRVPVDFAALARIHSSIGIAVRVGPYGSSDYSKNGKAAQTLVSVVKRAMADARKAGLSLAEVQIDFDCAESKLAGYREWLRAVREVADKTPMVFTALPAWLKHEQEFTALARASDGFVLQVHSVEKPASPDAEFALCDPERAMKWTRDAGRIASAAGVFFRVALPTYGYTLGFDSSGGFIGLSAEVSRDWPAGTQLRRVRTDAVAMSDLAQSLATANVANCAGIIWFRLPVASDRLNWGLAAFETVLRGGHPTAQLEAVLVQQEKGILEISLKNSGELTLDMPGEILVEWREGMQLEAADGVAGYALRYMTDTDSPGQRVRIVAPPAKLAAMELPPGQSRKIAWLRFKISHDNETLTNFVTAKIW